MIFSLRNDAHTTCCPPLSISCSSPLISLLLPSVTECLLPSLNSGYNNPSSAPSRSQVTSTAAVEYPLRAAASAHGVVTCVWSPASVAAESLHACRDPPGQLGGGLQSPLKSLLVRLHRQDVFVLQIPHRWTVAQLDGQRVLS